MRTVVNGLSYFGGFVIGLAIVLGILFVLFLMIRSALGKSPKDEPDHDDWDFIDDEEPKPYGKKWVDL